MVPTKHGGGYRRCPQATCSDLLFIMKKYTKKWELWCNYRNLRYLILSILTLGLGRRVLFYRWPQNRDK